MFEFFAAITAITSLLGFSEQQKSNKSQRNAQKAQREQQNMRAAMERRQAIRQMRQAQAVAMQNAENQGVGTSSGATGGQGSIITQGNANLSFLDDQITAANISGSYLDKAARQSANAQMWGAVGSLAQTAMGMSPQPKWLTDFMGTTNPNGATLIPSLPRPGADKNANPYKLGGQANYSSGWGTF